MTGSPTPGTDDTDLAQTVRDLQRRAAATERRAKAAEQQAGQAEGTAAQLKASLLVVVTTIGLLLSFAVPWLADVDVDAPEDLQVTGWQWTGLMVQIGDVKLDEEGLGFPGTYTLITLVVVLVAGASVFALSGRWIGITLAVLLSLLAVGHLLLIGALSRSEVPEFEEVLTGFWCAELLMVATAVAWGYWAQVQRDHPAD